MTIDKRGLHTRGGSFQRGFEGDSRTWVHPAICVLITLASFVIYFAWSQVMPLIEAPDEYLRYLVPHYIMEHGVLPVGWDETIRHPAVGTSYGFTVYGSSLVSVPFMLVANAFGADDQGLIAAARLSSVLFGAGTVALCFPIGSRLLKRPSSVVLLALLVGFLPQFAFLSSYLNSDTIEVFATAFVILALMRGVENGWRFPDCALLGVALGICALSYYFAYGAILVSIVVYFATARRGEPVRAKHASTVRGRMKESAARAYVVKPLIILAVALLIAGWFFVRNFILYDGDLFGMRANDLASELYGTDEWKPSMRDTLRNQGRSPLSVLTLATEAGPFAWITVSAQSFVGVFGYLSRFMDPAAYVVYFVILGIGLVVGLVSWLFERKQLLLCFGLLALMAIPVLLSVYFSWASDFQAQGRYLMAGMVPLMIFVAKGWESLSLLVERKSVVAGKVVRAAVIVLWLALFAFAMATIGIPFCTGGIYQIGEA